MKRTFILILAAAVLFAFAACSSESPDALNEAINAHNAPGTLSAEYSLEISTLSGSSIYYVKGAFDADRTAKKAYTSFAQSWLGSTAEGENYFSGGKVYSLSEDCEVYESTPDYDILALFPYIDIPLYGDSCKGLSKGENARGVSYTYTIVSDPEFCKKFTGDIYTLAYTIKEPQTDKTEYGDIRCTVTVADGVLLSFICEFDVKLFDKPAYIPGYSVPEEEYTTNLHVSAKLNYKDFSGGIPEYSAG
ncbi:MAG: hypothetical protein J5793_00405 [Clostridia bacterium]|nr:hypothetical protein [Clostridia bacterium]